MADKKGSCTGCDGSGGHVDGIGQIYLCDDCEGTGEPIPRVWVQDPYIKECLISVKETDLRSTQEK